MLSQQNTQKITATFYWVCSLNEEIIMSKLWVKVCGVVSNSKKLKEIKIVHLTERKYIDIEIEKDNACVRERRERKTERERDFSKWKMDWWWQYGMQE